MRHTGIDGYGTSDPENVPARFDGDGRDSFMKSMYSNYATMLRDKDGKNTGKLVMLKASAHAASEEVLKTHKKLEGEALTTYMNTYFEKTWNHYDVNQMGYVSVDTMPMFMRFLASD